MSSSLLAFDKPKVFSSLISGSIGEGGEVGGNVPVAVAVAAVAAEELVLTFLP